MFKAGNSSPQGLVLRFMREKRKMSLLSVGKGIDVKPKIIDHIEHGRRFIEGDDLLEVLGHYKFSLELYNEMLELKPLNKQMANHFFLSKKIY